MNQSLKLSQFRISPNKTFHPLQAVSEVPHQHKQSKKVSPVPSTLLTNLFAAKRPCQNAFSHPHSTSAQRAPEEQTTHEQTRISLLSNRCTCRSNQGPCSQHEIALIAPPLYPTRNSAFLAFYFDLVAPNMRNGTRRSLQPALLSTSAAAWLLLLVFSSFCIIVSATPLTEVDYASPHSCIFRAQQDDGPISHDNEIFNLNSYNSAGRSYYSLDSLPATRPSLQNPSAHRDASDGWTVADFVLVSSIDGSLHARDRHTGLEVWKIPSDRPLVHVSTSEALINRTKQHSLASSEPCDDCDLVWIVEPLGKGVLYYFTPATGIKQLPITIKELVMQSPFSLRGDDKIYIGSHSTTLYSIEASSGKVLKTYGAGKPNLAQPGSSPKFDNEDDEENEDDDESKTKENGSFMIGRTGMHLPQRQTTHSIC